MSRHLSLNLQFSQYIFDGLVNEHGEKDHELNPSVNDDSLVAPVEINMNEKNKSPNNDPNNFEQVHICQYYNCTPSAIVPRHHNNKQEHD